VYSSSDASGNGGHHPGAPESNSEQYESWQQIGGYFDGDGNVGVEVVKFTLRFRLRFSDTWRPQIKTIKDFLNERGLSTSELWRESNQGHLDAYRIEIVEIRSVLTAGIAMLQYCVKKAEDLRIMIDYLEGRITGNQAIERLNDEVRKGRRSGFIRELTLPYTRSEGLRIKELENARKARAAYHVDVSRKVQNEIRRAHRIGKLSFVKLSKRYGYSTKVIRRVLGAP
jgi:hypothetical protein